MKKYTLNLKDRKDFTRVHMAHSSAIFYRLLLLMLGALLITGIVQAQKQEGKYFNNLNGEGVILDGYDAVAFFTDNKPVKGEPIFQLSHKGAIYYFASQEHLNLFKANPKKYEPQFGGWCAYAVSLGRIAPIDVNTFSIVDGRLFIQHNQRAVNGWNKDVSGNIVKADKYWPAVSYHQGKQIKTDEEKGYLNNTDPDGVTLQGYDAVAYFTQMKAVKGNPEFFARYNGATYWFSSEANASMFKDHPEMFAPQYGSFCGYAMSLGKLRPINPQIFDVIEGRLILQHTQEAYTQFHKDLPGNISKADAYWPKEVRKHAGKKVKFDKPAKSTPETTSSSK